MVFIGLVCVFSQVHALVRWFDMHIAWIEAPALPAAKEHGCRLDTTSRYGRPGQLNMHVTR